MAISIGSYVGRRLGCCLCRLVWGKVNLLCLRERGGREGGRERGGGGERERETDRQTDRHRQRE